MQFDLYSITVAGVLVVFVALAMIAMIVSGVRQLDEYFERRALKKQETEPVPEPVQNIDDTTLVLISAAVATMVAGRHHITNVRKITPDFGRKNVWSQQGRAVLLGSHAFTKRT